MSKNNSTCNEMILLLEEDGFVYLYDDYIDNGFYRKVFAKKYLINERMIIWDIYIYENLSSLSKNFIVFHHANNNCVITLYPINPHILHLALKRNGLFNNNHSNIVSRIGFATHLGLKDIKNNILTINLSNLPNPILIHESYIEFSTE